MGLPTYNCTKEFERGIPDILSMPHVRVLPDRHPDRKHCYIFRRGLGTVQFSGFIEKEGDPYSFFLTCGRNPLFWFFDMRLLAHIESVLLSRGASKREPKPPHKNTTPA